jgi:hypothetical protein
MTIIDPGASTAEVRVSSGSPAKLKNTAVKTSAGTDTPTFDVLQKVTIRLLPSWQNCTEADRFPLLPTKAGAQIGVACASVENAKRTGAARADTRHGTVIMIAPRF